LSKDNTQINKGGHRKKCSISRQIGHNRNNCPDKHVDKQTATPTETTTPAETAPDAQTAENAPTVETAENAPTAETQTTQPPRNEVESQAAPLPTPEEPSQQFMMKLQIRRRP